MYTKEKIILDNVDLLVSPEAKKALILFAEHHLNKQKEEIKLALEKGLETFGISLTDDFLLEQTGNDIIDNAYKI